MEVLFKEKGQNHSQNKITLYWRWLEESLFVNRRHDFGIIEESLLKCVNWIQYFAATIFIEIFDDYIVVSSSKVVHLFRIHVSDRWMLFVKILDQRWTENIFNFIKISPQVLE